jgi:TetR/AcrR family transcriptional regulator, transcriptional repressor of bet genes
MGRKEADVSAGGAVRVRRETGWKMERYPQTVAGAKQEMPDLRNGLVRAALQIALQDGLDGVSVDEVAAQTNVSPALVLQNFGSHDGLMLALLDVVLARTLDAERDLRAPGSGPRQLGDMVAAELEGLRDQAPVVELMFMFYFTRGDDRYRARIRDALATYRGAFESALEGVQLRRGVDASVMSSIVIAFLQGAAVQAIRDPDNFHPSEAIAAMRVMLEA